MNSTVATVIILLNNNKEMVMYRSGPNTLTRIYNGNRISLQSTAAFQDQACRIQECMCDAICTLLHRWIPV